MKKVFIDDLYAQLLKVKKMDFALFYDGDSLDEYFKWYSMKLIPFAGRDILLMGFYGGVVQSYPMSTYDEVVGTNNIDELNDEIFSVNDESIGKYYVNKYFNSYIKNRYPDLEYVYVEEFDGDGDSLEMRELNQSIMD